MTLPTHKQLMLAAISSNEALKVAHIQAERHHAQTLQEAWFTTAAFLHLWIVTEVAAKELMNIYKYTKETKAALKKLQLELKRALQPHLSVSSKKEAHAQAQTLIAKALPSLIGPLQSIFNDHAKSASRQLDLAVIKSALTTLEVSFNSSRVEYLLASKVAALPDGIDLKDKTTVRERRNKLVHSNGTVTAETAAALLPMFDEFFSLLLGTSATPHQDA
ncbi:hypothetical protein [Shewanella sp.]|uniref:hypothetical protein n=1 Tax=Shewanella sp. TaxID=50422 RepID=UPI000E9B75ED|nr:hypothetical protein [Shewanella sp.]HAY94629.1 hypothetical protein [Shewanella sp.]